MAGKELTFSDIEISILHHAQEIIRDEFKVESNRLYHYTKAPSANSIVSSQVFQSTFIRSSSDSLEFANPMAACRDWVCFSSNLFSLQNFPIELFRHFNEEATDPSARAYFISLSSNSKSEHLKSMYGDTRVEFQLDSIATDFDSYGFFLHCKYKEDIKAEVYRLLNRWRKEAFGRAVTEHKIKDPRENMGKWFYTLMHFCNVISLGIKQEAFSREEETRVVVFPGTPDTATRWHEKRDVKPLSAKSLIMREFLPLNLKVAGLTVAEVAD